MTSRRAVLGGLSAALSSCLIPLTADADTVVYAYDALGRVVTATYGNGTVITYNYDPAGNRTQVVQGDPAPSTPLTASLSVTSWAWTWAEPEPPAVPPAVTVAVAGGIAPYAYAWERVSGDSLSQANSPSSGSTSFSRDLDDYPTGPPRASIWRCKVTDSTSTIAYAGNVQVTFYHTA